MLNFLKRRTLFRRVLLAAWVAFIVVWVSLLGRTWWQLAHTTAFDRFLRYNATNLAAAMAPLQEPNDAIRTLNAFNRLFSKAQVDPTGWNFSARLTGPDGRVLVDSPLLAAGPPTCSGPSAPVLLLPGQSHLRCVRLQAGRWLLDTAMESPEPMEELRRDAAELTVNMLIAFPLVLLPVWVAVSLGLRPLRALSDRIRARHSDDLSPVGVVVRHEELKPLVDSIDDLLTRLRTKVAREQRFVQDAAHELRTPMAVISAQAHALVHAADEQGRHASAAQLLHAIERASHLATQLLQLAQLDHAATQAGQPMDLAAFVRQTLADWAPRALDRGIELSLDAPESLVAQLEVAPVASILQNLLDNALRYLPAGTQVRVALSRLAEDRLRLRVEDDGPGIPEAMRDRVFERFVRGPDERSSGTGLGLAIVRQASQRLGGGVTLSPGPNGRGCCFVVDCPG